MTGFVATQAPAWQVSDWVQALPSLQALPLALSGLEQMPLAGSQTPASWHWSRAEQTTGFVPTQAPASQVSDWVQALPSVQALPVALSGLEQMPLAGSQTPASWHWSRAEQTTGFVPTQAPASQVSDWVQALPSVQALPVALSGLEQMPLAGSQTPASWHWSRAEQTTGFVPTQAPASQVSDWVQALPSVQALPVALSGLEQMPLAGSQTPASWHWSRAEQTTGFVPTQAPASQVSDWVQALPSVQALPVALSGLEQMPLAGSQTPASWHWSRAEQTTGFVPTQAPASQVSDWVQALPSVQALPVALSGLEQMPLAGSQTPASWHWSRAEQTTGFVPTQAPASQVSDWVQALPSVQALPVALSGLEQMPLAGSQTPASWHWSRAEQTTGFVPTQAPASQVSDWVQALPSVQALPLALSGLEQMPLDGSQTPASWHWSRAEQTTGFAPTQAPASQVSVWVQASPSVQTVPFGFSGLEQMPLAGSQTPALWH